MGNGGWGQFVTRLCCSFLLEGRTPHTLPLLKCEIHLMGDSAPYTSPVWVLPFHKLPQHGSLPWGAGLQEQAAPVWVFIMGCRGKSCLLRHLEHILPLLLHWPWCLQSFFSHIVSILSLDCCPTANFTPSSICYYRGATTIADWLGLGQWFRAGWHWLYQTWGKLLAASYRSHPLVAPCYQNLAMQPHNTGE